MVTFVVERTPSNVRNLDAFQMRNEWNDDVKKRSDDVTGLVTHALEYAAYQGDDIRIDVTKRDFARLAKDLGGSKMGGFDLGF